LQKKIIPPGKDASEIWNKIHPRDAILIHAPWVIIGTVDTGSQTDDILATFNAKNAITVRDNKNKAEYTLEEVQKHNREDDAWVTIQGDVLNVTQFLNEHPGGRLVILNLIGKDATEEFLSIHPADVYRKHAPYLIIGSLSIDMILFVFSKSLFWFSWFIVVLEKSETCCGYHGFCFEFRFLVSRSW